MAGQRFGIADIHETLDQLERVIELLAGFESSLDSKRHQRAPMAAEIFSRESVIGTVREPRVVDPLNSVIVAQEFGYPPAVLNMTLDPQRHRFDALQEQERAHGR